MSESFLAIDALESLIQREVLRRTTPPRAVREDLAILLDALSTQWLTPEQSKAYDRLKKVIESA